MKKFLSLVLALVMTMSLVTVSAGAKEFADDESITYGEAVNVISEIGVVDGDQNGNLDPTRTLTRQAAAKIICNLILGPTTASQLPAQVAPYSDVPTTSEFAGYIAYCQSAGIISGYADGTFRPTATLTGNAFMKMLLCALGYNQYTEGYAGVDNWGINVTKQAVGSGLTKGLVDEFNGSKAVTRQEACLYAFNTLQADLVEYNTVVNTTINGQNVTIGSSTAQSRTWQSSTSEVNNINAHDGIIQFAEEYFPKLVKKADNDDFGRPVTTWTYDLKELGTYLNTENLVATYTEKVTGKDLYELISKSVLDDCTVTVYVDGVENTTANKDLLGSAYFTKGNIVKTNTEKVGATGNGVTTQVFVDTDAKQIDIIIVNTYLAKASEDYSEKNDSVTLTVYDVQKSGTQYVKTAKAEPTIKVKGEDIDVSSVAKDDLFLVTIAAGKIQTMDKPEILSAATIESFKKTKWVSVDGTTYNYADTARYDAEVLDEYDDQNMKNVTYNVILDKSNYLIGLEINDADDNYVFITGIENGGSNLYTKNIDANAIFTDGTMSTITINAKDSATALTAAKADGLNRNDAQLNTWFTYSKDSKDVYTLTIVPTASGTTGKNSKLGQSSIDASSDITIDSGHISLIGFDGNRVYGNDNTVYLNVTTDSLSNITATLGGTYRIIDDVDSVTVGVKNVKFTVSNLSSSTVNGTAYAAPTYEIYPLFNTSNVIKACVVIGEDEGTTSSYAYITSADATKESRNNGDDTWTWEREAVVDGVDTVLTYTGSSLKYIGSTMSRGSVYQVKFDTNGKVRKVTEVIPDNITAGVADDLDDAVKYVSDVEDVEVANEKYDDVVLFADYTTNHASLTYKDGSLWVATNINKGFSVKTDVKVVLITADSSATPFDDTDDTYTGYAGLQAALNNMNSSKGSFNGKLIAIFDKSDAANTIIIDDRTAKGVDKGTDSNTSTTTTTSTSSVQNIDVSVDGLNIDATFQAGTSKANMKSALSKALAAKGVTAVSFDTNADDYVVSVTDSKGNVYDVDVTAYYTVTLDGKVVSKAVAYDGTVHATAEIDTAINLTKISGRTGNGYIINAAPNGDDGTLIEANDKSTTYSYHAYGDAAVAFSTTSGSVTKIDGNIDIQTGYYAVVDSEGDDFGTGYVKAGSTYKLPAKSADEDYHGTGVTYKIGEDGDETYATWGSTISNIDDDVVITINQIKVTQSGFKTKSNNTTVYVDYDSSTYTVPNDEPDENAGSGAKVSGTDYETAVVAYNTALGLGGDGAYSEYDLTVEAGYIELTGLGETFAEGGLSLTWYVDGKKVTADQIVSAADEHTVKVTVKTLTAVPAGTITFNAGGSADEDADVARNTVIDGTNVAYANGVITIDDDQTIAKDSTVTITFSAAQTESVEYTVVFEAT